MLSALTSAPHGQPSAGPASRLLSVLANWWGLAWFGAVALVLALTPSTHAAAGRAATARMVHATTWQALPWFAVLSALVGLALTRIVVVTAQSYGLSQLALEMVVRVLVLELIPLSAALFVLLRAAMSGDVLPAPAGLAGGMAALRGITLARWRLEIVPRVLALAFAVLALAVTSGVLVLALAYTVTYGFSPWGFDAYTRMIGRVFDAPVGLGLVLKTLLFSLAVGVVPLASALQESTRRPASTTGFAVRSGTVRVTVLLLLVEATSVAVKYL